MEADGGLGTDTGVISTECSIDDGIPMGSLSEEAVVVVTDTEGATVAVEGTLGRGWVEWDDAGSPDADPPALELGG